MQPAVDNLQRLLPARRTTAGFRFSVWGSPFTEGEGQKARKTGRSRNEGIPEILVAEDNVLLRLNTFELLEEHGYTVVEAGNAEEALKVMENRNDVRLLFTDIQMPPGVDGLELAREVHRRWPKVILVITSGQIQPARADIADDGRFIQKPYRDQDLLDQIDDLITIDDHKLTVRH